MSDRRLVRATREAVLAALAEHDQIGQAAFLAKYGFKKAVRYRLMHNGKAYDSKAIIGAAFSYLPGSPPPLTAPEFSGGAATVEKHPTTLGFTVEQASQTTPRNPPWTRDEVILALDLYIGNRETFLPPEHAEVIALSDTLKAIAQAAGSEILPQSQRGCNEARQLPAV